MTGAEWRAILQSEYMAGAEWCGIGEEWISYMTGEEWCGIGEEWIYDRCRVVWYRQRVDI